MKLFRKTVRIEDTAKICGGTVMEQLTIRENIKKVKKGDRQAFEKIVTLFQSRIYHHCLRMIGSAHEAEDLAQEAFVRAYLNIHSFDEHRKFSSWLYRIATNLTIDHIRKRKPDYHLEDKVRHTEGLTMYSRMASKDPLPEEVVENLELRHYIQKNISELPPIYRSIIILRYIEEFPLKEISEILDIPLGTVKTRIRRGREALRKKLRHL